MLFSISILSIFILIQSYLLFRLWTKLKIVERNELAIDKTRHSFFNLILSLSNDNSRKEAVIDALKQYIISNKVENPDINLSINLAELESKLAEEENKENYKLLALYKFDIHLGRTPSQIANEKLYRSQKSLLNQLKRQWKKNRLNKVLIVVGSLLVIVHALFFAVVIILKLVAFVYSMTH